MALSENQIDGYSFKHGEPGLFLEIYVPTPYEPEMRKILEAAANIDEVRKYLKENNTRISEFLSEHYTVKGIDERTIDLLEPILEGFSIYRGDGAFATEAGFLRDSISLVRLMFTPRLKKWFPNAEPSDLIFAARQFLRYWTHDEKKYRQHRSAGLETQKFDESQLVTRLTQWLENIHLLVNGYVVYRLCDESVRRAGANLAWRPEAEIWVGSFRCLAVNKVVLNERS
jgi:hypothetical protein